MTAWLSEGRSRLPRKKRKKATFSPRARGQQILYVALRGISLAAAARSRGHRRLRDRKAETRKHRIYDVLPR